MEGGSAMSAFITALTGSLTSSSLWGVFTDIVPFLAIIVPVALGFYFVRRLIKGTSKAKVRV